MNLVIVESPTKARKLSGFLGKDYVVESSVGHIVDLPKSKLGVDVENNFKPEYEISADKKKVAKQLQTLAKKAEVIYLASDPDREGEAIAWHVQHVIEDDVPDEVKGVKKGTKKFVRATFHEITKEAVLEAIENPGKINIDLVDAQQARRVLDRLVGYKVSPVLWKKIRRGLSAGRVQSVALRLIVEREKEIKAFVPEEYWEVNVILDKDKVKLNEKEVAELNLKELPDGMMLAEVMKVDGKKYAPKKEAEVSGVVADLKVADYHVAELEKKNRKRESFPPFMTSTLQQAAATRLGMTSKQTMSLAQNLYEEGLITYHRTDSLNLGAKAVTAARAYIGKEFGDKYLPEKARVFTRKSKNAQEAHEAIRATNINLSSIDPNNYPRFTNSHARLYDLIWRRFMASQMSAAVYDQTTVKVEAKKEAHNYELKVNGSILKFDGWMKLFPNREDKILPELTVGQEIFFVKENAEQKFTQPPARYNDASIIKELESRGIGRPSTYASIISVIIDRGYVERKEKKFFATPVGITVSDFLMENLRNFVEYDFTAEMEEDLDRIANGEKKWQKVIGDFYGPFLKKLTEVDETADRVQVPVEPTDEPCPECHETEGGMLVIRGGKYGKFLSCGRYPDCKYARPIINKVEGLQCPLCGEGDVIERDGRFGKFYGCSRYPDCDWTAYKKPAEGEKISAGEWATIKAQRAERAAKRKATMEAKKEASGASAVEKKPRKKPAKKSTKSTAKTTKPKTTTKTTAKKRTSPKK